MKNNEEKFDLLVEELADWIAHGNDSDDSMVFAFEHGYMLHAVSLWQSTGASQYTFDVEIDREEEAKELHHLFLGADILVLSLIHI